MPRQTASLSHESAQRHASRLSAQSLETFELRRSMKSATDLLSHYSTKRFEARLLHGRHVHLYNNLENAVSVVQKVHQAANDMKILIDAMEHVCVDVNEAIERAFQEKTSDAVNDLETDQNTTVQETQVISKHSTEHTENMEQIQDELKEQEPPSPPKSSPSKNKEQVEHEQVEAISTRPRRNATKKIASFTEPRLGGKLRRGDPFTFQ